MMPAIPISALGPELMLLAGGCVVLMLGQAARAGWRGLSPWVALIALTGAIGLVWVRPTEMLVGSGLAYGSLAVFVRISALELGILFTLINWSQAREGERGEYLSMMLFSLVGLLLVGPADNLLLLFMALELVSIPTYIMVVLGRTRAVAAEAGTKYFYLGALSAAIMAYGFALLYGVSGSASLPATALAVREALAQPGTLAYGLAVTGLVLSIGGLLFKIAAVPLHFYIADVYQGAASPVAGLLGFVPKLAGLIAIFKLVLMTGQWQGAGNAVFWLLWVVAVASMCVGNVLALRQANIKRMLGYSGIAHAGYMLVGMLAGPLAGPADETGSVGILGNGTASVLYYVVVYGIANLGAFAVLGLLRVRDQACETLRDVAGLLRRQPGLALILALTMFTLMGLPPTPGFWGKLGLFSSALAAAQGTVVPGQQTWLIVLVIIGVLNSAVAAAYYLRVIAAVLLYENERPAHAMPREAQHIGALICGFLLLVFALWPNGLMSSSVVATNELVDQIPPEEMIGVTDQPGGESVPEEFVVGSAGSPRVLQRDGG